MRRFSDSGGDPSHPSSAGNIMIDQDLLDILVCPDCKRPVAKVDPAQGEKEEAWLVCSGCGLAYPVRDGIPIMLIEEARRPDRKPTSQ
jgi:uncharacterized protein YbaR (Trm112 family)